jgi:hypothetical protein
MLRFFDSRTTLSRTSESAAVGLARFGKELVLTGRNDLGMFVVAVVESVASKPAHSKNEGTRHPRIQRRSFRSVAALPTRLRVRVGRRFFDRRDFSDGAAELSHIWPTATGSALERTNQFHACIRPVTK